MKRVDVGVRGVLVKELSFNKKVKNINIRFYDRFCGFFV